MEVYLVRHTETVCAKGICYGQADVELRVPYVEQFQQIKGQLPQNAFFYSSPLQRCTILADYLSSSDYKVDPRLMEMHFGSWELKRWNDIPPEEINPWMDDFVNIKATNGESFVELNKRVLSFIEEKSTANNSPVVIVTHAGVIRSFLCREMNIPLKDAFSNKVEFGQVVKINL
jgi:alpha-ribazole phosphatase